ncbi:MAG: hypothetical protein ACYDHC_02915 [Desulfuromonadaceae bacterium]
MFSDIDDIFYECDKCRSEIGFSNIIWEISKSEGRFIKDHGEVAIEPLKEESLIAFCAFCGSSSIDFNEIRNNLSIYSEEENESLDGAPFNESATSLEICDKCGTGIGIGEVVIKINCSTGKIECNSPSHHIPDYFVNESETICTLCQDCGEMMNNIDLKTVLHDTVVKSPFDRPNRFDSMMPTMAIEMNRRL